MTRFGINNGINEQNHASSDITIKNLMEEKEVMLNDSLVKTASWIHNTNVDKLEFTPLKHVIGKSCNLLSLTMGNVTSEIISDTEAMKML